MSQMHDWNRDMHNKIYQDDNSTLHSLLYLLDLLALDLAHVRLLG